MLLFSKMNCQITICTYLWIYLFIIFRSCFVWYAPCHWWIMEFNIFKAKTSPNTCHGHYWSHECQNPRWSPGWCNVQKLSPFRTSRIQVCTYLHLKRWQSLSSTIPWNQFLANKELAVMNSFLNLVFFLIFQVGQWHIEVLRQKSKSHRHAPDQMFEIKITGSLWWKIVRNHARQFWACWPAFCDSNRGQLPSFYTLPTHSLWRITVYLSFRSIFYLVI